MGTMGTMGKTNDSKQYVSLDSDYKGHMLCMLAEYHNYIIYLWKTGELEHRVVMDTCYLLGNIEGRVIGNCITIDDVEMLELWEEELDAYKLQ